MPLIMLERNESAVEFDQMLRTQKFHEAGVILTEHCHGLTLPMIEEILAAAYVSGYGLKFDDLPNKLKHRKSRIQNAIERLKTRKDPNHSLAQRRQKNQGIRPQNLRDGKHRKK